MSPPPFRVLQCFPASLAPLFFLVLVFGLFTSCSRNIAEELTLPHTSVIQHSPAWAVVEFDYLPLYQANNASAEPLWIARKGDIYRIQDRALNKEVRYNILEYWYRVESKNLQAWAHGSGLSFYQNEEQAINSLAGAESE